MYILVNRIQFKELSLFQKIIWRAFRLLASLHKPKGLRSVIFTETAQHQFLLEAWESREDMLHFRRSDKHSEMMKKVRGLINRVESVQFEHSGIPDWEEIHARFADKNKA